MCLKFPPEILNADHYSLHLAISIIILKMYIVGLLGSHINVLYL